MKLGSSILGGIAGLLLASQAQALTYTDFNLYDSATGYVGDLQTLSGTFNIAVSDGGPGDFGYDPAVERVVSAFVEFSIFDDDIFDEDETFRIDFGSQLFLEGSATLAIETGDVKGKALVDLRADGSLHYTITSTGGDFYVESAILVATTAPRNVPDGGDTAVLLGTSLLGLLALRQKLATATANAS